MATDPKNSSTSANNRNDERAQLTSEVRLVFPNLGGFIDVYSDNISEGGMFIHTDEVKPIGTLIELSIKLNNNKSLIKGKGVVVWVRNAGEHSKLPGMGIKFTELDAPSTAVIKSIVELNREVSKVSIPENPNAFIKPTNLAPDPPDVVEPVAAKAPAEPVAKPAEKKVTTAPKKSIVIGIDLGTTNSCVAYVENGVPSVIPSTLGYMTTPSMVALNPKSKIIVGQLAYDQIVTNPTNTIYGSKRLIGRPFNSPTVQQMKNYFTYEIVEAPDHQCAVRLGDRVLSLPEVSAYILNELKDVAQGTLDCEVVDAVISVPAYYNDNQRTAVKKAGELAGLNVLRIVNEPTAAAMAYGFNKQLKERVMVFDLGGGTFDVSVLEIAGNVFKVIATGGDTFLGGTDFDRRVIFEVLRRFKEKHGVELNNDKVALQRIKNASEKCKKDLSFQDEVTMSLPYIARKEGTPVDLVMQLTRKELEDLTADLIRRALDITNRVLESKKLKFSDIDEVLLVGGQTRMPLVRKMVEELCKKEPRKGVHPDEVVAIGTALLADSLKRESLVKLQDVLSMPIGIAIPGGKFKVVVDKNTPLPYRKDYKLSNLDPTQPKLEIDIYQGESDKIIDNEYLGTFTFDFSGIARKDGAKIQLAMTFSLDEECLLLIVATDQHSGKSYQSKMVTKDTPDSLKEAIKLAMNQKGGKGDKDAWLPDFAKKVIKN